MFRATLLTGEVAPPRRQPAGTAAGGQVRPGEEARLAPGAGRQQVMA
jgi:hypothetical protein